MKIAFHFLIISVFLSSCKIQVDSYSPPKDLFRHRILLSSDSTFWSGICDRAPDFRSTISFKRNRILQKDLLCEDGSDWCSMQFKKDENNWLIRLGHRWYPFYDAAKGILVPAPPNESVQALNYMVVESANIDGYKMLAFKYYSKHQLENNKRMIWFNPYFGVVAIHEVHHTYVREDFWDAINRAPGSGS